MNDPARPQTTRDRDRAVARIRALTAGTAIAGVVATAGFGVLAASNYSGRQAATGTAGSGSGSVVTDDGSSSSSDEGSSSTSDDGATSNQGSTSLQPPLTVTTPAFGRGQVTTGGSSR